MEEIGDNKFFSKDESYYSWYQAFTDEKTAIDSLPCKKILLNEV